MHVITDADYTDDHFPQIVGRRNTAETYCVDLLLECGHYVTVHEASSVFDFLVDGDYCQQCGATKRFMAPDPEDAMTPVPGSPLAVDVETQLRDALAVLVLTPATRAWLTVHDPEALKQAVAALRAAGMATGLEV